LTPVKARSRRRIKGKRGPSAPPLCTRRQSDAARAARKCSPGQGPKGIAETPEKRVKSFPYEPCAAASNVQPRPEASHLVTWQEHESTNEKASKKTDEAAGEQTRLAIGKFHSTLFASPSHQHPQNCTAKMASSAVCNTYTNED
jgi:hypothetical protein